MTSFKPQQSDLNLYIYRSIRTRSITHGLLFCGHFNDIFSRFDVRANDPPSVDSHMLSMNDYHNCMGFYYVKLKAFAEKQVK